ncbi:MAG: choice-of-anchor D domain-containing protein [Ignavibacteria bacterium]|nr:choice-of-anchor D domain-containing protein [Ignavibacteria bacterium]
MPLRYGISITLVLMCLVRIASAQYPASCDVRKDCIFNAVTLSTTSGRNAHYVEINNQPTRPRQAALTFEMWVKIERQAGKRQFLGGLWGPNRDANDVWVVYIDENDQLTFEVNADGTALGDIDNTVVRANASNIYDQWNHIAAVFDGTSASVSLFINGIMVAGPVSNPSYPATYLRPPEKPELFTIVGSCNALADNANLYRSMKGQFDEVRLWTRALSQNELICSKDLSLNGNEAGLQVYFRCNEPLNNIVQLCDATGNNYTGLLRNGASNQSSNRRVPRTISASPSSVTQEIRCDSVVTWTFTVVDTGYCQRQMSARMRGRESGSFTVSPANLTLSPNVSQTITVTFRGTNVGSFLDTLQLRTGNRCDSVINIKFNLKRLTEISSSRSAITFDTLLVGCIEQKFIDSTITICNTSDSLGQPRTLRIANIRAREPKGYQVINVTYPIVLQPGQCTTLTVRCFVRDTTADYIDTLLIFSDDRCQSKPLEVALIGRTQEVISIRSSDGSRRIDTMSFSPTCPGMLSSPQYYVWQNLTLSPLIIDTILVPPDFTHYRYRFPVTLLPATGYQPVAVRFRPQSPGQKFDSVIIRTKVGNCTVERTIKVRGRGLDNKVEWSVNGLLDFGSVIVGQQRTLNVVAKNTSQFDVLNVSIYVERGDAFTLLAGTGRSIRPGDSTSIPVTFRPTDSLLYTDRLCLFETRCYTVDCIDIRGKGILQTFKVSPLVMETQNVVGCGSELDTVCLENISNQPQTISSLLLANASGKFALVDPVQLPSTLTLGVGESACFVFRYTPNDVVNDRADRAYLTYKDANGTDWQIQLIGTSATPKLFITQTTAYGTVEVGDVRRATLIVENTSSMMVSVDSLSVGPGFSIISTSRPLPTDLNPRDSIRVDVEFRPTAAQNYSAQLRAYSSAPCTITGSGDLTGRGVIIELENPLSLVNFGYVRPCDCITRTVELFNGSQVFDMTVDSIWIDSANIPGGKPQYFTWASKFSPGGVVPYSVPPGERDTVFITFCPNTPADAAQLESRAAFHVAARGSAWSKTLETFIIGKRSLTFQPSPLSIQFPAGAIDVLSPVQRFVTIKIPGIAANPQQDTVVLDSITFTPDERVFSILSPTVFPITILPGDSIQIEVRQRPRAPRIYSARLTLHYSTPCPGTDTTVLILGAGFAQPRGLAFSFDPTRALPDTFGMVSCDTLIIPLYSSIFIDASVVDVMMRVNFDSTQLRLLDVLSPLLTNSCISQTGGITYVPQVQTAPSAYGGIAVTLKNFCGIDSSAPFCLLRFVTVANNRVNSPVSVDSINFDTEDVILYKLIATGDRGTILAYKSEISIMQPSVYDSVRILDCVDRTVVVYNTGDIGNTIDSLINLPLYTTVVSSMPPLGDSISPGDSAVITLRFCPGSERFIDTSSVAVSLQPCDTRDTTAVTGYGYAPEVEIQVGAMQQFFVADTLKGTLGDTVTIPIQLDSGIAATYQGNTYWLKSFDATINITYNARALKYIDAPYLSREDEMSVSSTPGNVVITGSDLDSLKSGEVARLRFLVTVPDININDITVEASGFISDSLQFIDVVPNTVITPFSTTGKCNITVLKFDTLGAPMIGITPNPVADDATITFRMYETVPVVLELFNSSGFQTKIFLDGSIVLPGGEYAVRFSSADLPAGLYHARIAAGVFSSTKAFIVVK